MNKTFTDIYFHGKEKPVFCYRSGNLVYEEMMAGGTLVSCGYNTAGYPLNVLSGFPSRIDYTQFAEPFSFNIEIDGQSLDYNLKFIDFEIKKDGENTEGILTLESNIKAVRIYIHTILDTTQMFTRYIEIENLSDKSMCLSRLSVISGCAEEMDRDELTTETDLSELYSVGYFDRADWSHEGDFKWRNLNTDTLSVDTRFGRDRFRHPLIFIKNNVLGTILFAQIAWSAGCRFSVDLNARDERDKSFLGFKAEITGYKPLRVISPKEIYRTPDVHIGMISGSLDDAVNEMHSHIRKSVLTEPVNTLVFAGMGAEHDMSVETTKTFIDQFAEMGAEVFTLDAGWVCPPDKQTSWGEYNGTNIPDKDRYPDTMKVISDYVHEKGMKFCLWIDIESAGKETEIFKAHPEWKALDIYGNRTETLLDFTNPEVTEWAENELIRMIEEYDVDVLRVDNNLNCKQYFTMGDTGSGIQECHSFKRMENVYKMYANLRKHFPDMIFENCAGGGGRTDLGMMKHFNHTWVSDWQKAPRSVVVTNGMTMALPPERVDRLFAGMGGHRFGSLDLQMRNTMLTHLTLNVINPADAKINDAQMEFVRHSVDLYKNFIRDILPESRVYHHVPETDRNSFTALEIASPDKKKSVIAAYNLSMAKDEFITIFPRGIDPSKEYSVTFDNTGSEFSVKGYDLMTKGIRIRIPSSMSSELILFEAN